MYCCRKKHLFYLILVTTILFIISVLQDRSTIFNRVAITFNVTLSDKDAKQLDLTSTKKRSHSKLIFAGVMTTSGNLATRARAVALTWASAIQGDVQFFCGMTCNNSVNHPELNLTILPLTPEEDTYPPQRKSFMMLKYMYEKLLDKYEWFLRADDDVYVNTDKLSNFLRSLDSNKLHFIGHSAFGRSHEEGKLGLANNSSYCMGGPGIVLNRKTLALMGPHIEYCMNHLYTEHEDTELARCVYKFVGIPCTLGKKV